MKEIPFFFYFPLFSSTYRQALKTAEMRKYVPLESKSVLQMLKDLFSLKGDTHLKSNSEISVPLDWK